MIMMMMIKEEVKGRRDYQRQRFCLDVVPKIVTLNKQRFRGSRSVNLSCPQSLGLVGGAEVIKVIIVHLVIQG